MSKSQSGKGDSPRNIFSDKYRKNYGDIDWSKKKQKKKNDLLRGQFPKPKPSK